MTRIEAMKAKTIGVEIEMNSIRRDRAAKIAADFFGTGRYADTAHRNGYRTWSAWDANGREWKFQRDASILGEESEKCELVTPILRYDDIETLQELCRRLRKAGAKSDASRGCGVHIHIGAQGMDAKAIRNLVNLTASLEELLIAAIGISNRRLNSYCKRTHKGFLAALNERKPNTREGLSDLWYTSQGATYGRSQHYNESRYHILNLHATFTKGTVEFRCFQFDAPDGDRMNGIHAGLIKAYVNLCLAMVVDAEMAKYIRVFPRQVNALTMRDWLNRFGLKGEEFATTRELLTKKLPRTNSIAA